MIDTQAGSTAPSRRVPRRGPQFPRLTVVESVYFESPGHQPILVPTQTARTLASDEQPYQRQLLIGETWTRLDTGWIQEASLLVLTNDEGRPERGPSVDAGALAGRVVELVCRNTIIGDGESIEPEWLLPPGESFRGTPARPGAIYLRCRQGAVRCTLTLFPS